MNASTPVAADEAGRLAELSAKASANLRDTVLNIIHAAGGDPTRINEAVESLRSLPYRLVPATPTQSEDALWEEIERLKHEADGEFVQAAVRVMKANPGFNARDYAHDGITADDFEMFFTEDMNEAWAQVEKLQAELATLRATPTPPAPSRDAVEAMEEIERLKREADGEFVQAAIRAMQANPGFVSRDYAQDGISADDFESFITEDMNEAWRQVEKLQAEVAALAATQAPAEPSPGAEAALLRERLQAIIDWADLVEDRPGEFSGMGLRVLSGPVFDAARAALSQSAGGR